MFKVWTKVSPREQRLAVLTGVLVTLAFAYFAYVHATDRLAAMDAEIEALEQDLIFYTEQMGLLDEVDRAYQGVASEHSSEWTQEEIHDRLRREIARLSLVNSPPPGAHVSLSGGGAHLVDIRQMPQGSLTASDSGYRQYQLTIQTQPTTIQNITTFLERLHKSPQALRIASLDLTRAPNLTAVTARINVIRSVIDTEKAGPSPAAPDPSKNWILNSGFEDWQDERIPDAWTLEGATAAADENAAVEGEKGVIVTAAEAGAMYYQTVELTAGEEFVLEFSMKSTGPVHVRAFDEASSTFVGGDVALTAGPTVQRYRVRLAVPGQSGAPVAIRLPVFVLDNAGTKLTLDQVKLNEVGA